MADRPLARPASAHWSVQVSDCGHHRGLKDLNYIETVGGVSVTLNTAKAPHCVPSFAHSQRVRACAGLIGDLQQLRRGHEIFVIRGQRPAIEQPVPTATPSVHQIVD
jgi:hypothetical protein